MLVWYMFAMKTNIITLARRLTATLSSLLVVAVFLTATHAKDVLMSSALGILSSDTPAVRTHDDISAKALSDLHSHVDKTMVKDPGMNKSFGDNAALAARRERDETEEEQPLSLKMIEMMLMVKLAYAYATS